MRAIGLALLGLAAIGALTWWGLATLQPAASPDAASVPPDQVPWSTMVPAQPIPAELLSAVSGRVVDPLGTPIANCDITLLAATGVTLEPALAPILAQTRTGLDGRFHLSGEADSGRLLLIRHPKFPPRTIRLPPAAPGDVGDIRLASAIGCRITVYRAGEPGKPIDGADVVLRRQLLPADLAQEPGRTMLERSGRTDLRGEVLFHGVDAGGYRVRVAAAECATREFEYVKPDSGPPQAIVVHLPVGLALSGRVVTDGGAGVADAEVTVTAGPYQRAGAEVDGVRVRTYRPELTTRSSDQGGFRLGGLDSGAVRVRIDAPSRASITRDESLPLAAPLTVTLPPAATISGRLVDALTGEPVAGGRIRATPVNGFVGTGGGRFVDWAAVADEQGNFRIGGLPTGRFTITAASEEHQLARVGPVSTSAEVSELPTIELMPAASIRGRVLDPGGRPVAGASIEVMDPRDDGSEWTELLRSAVPDPARRPPAQSDQSGAFRAVVEPPASGQIRLRVAAPGYVTLWTEPLDLPPGSRSFAVDDLQLPTGHTLIGIARDRDGRPVTGATVCAEPVTTDDSSTVRERLRTATDTDGRFRLGPLARGTYDVFYYPRSVGTAAAAAEHHATTRARISIPGDAHAELELAPR